MVVLGTSLGPAVGPVLGGVLTTYLSWRWCFFVNVPFGTAALLIGLLFLAEHREPAAGRLDVPGFVLAGAGLALFLYALSESPVRGWTSPVIIGTGLAGVVTLAALVLVELRSAAPMVNLRLLRNRIFRTASLVSMCSMGAYSGYLFTMPEFLQQARGASALSSGLTTFPGALGVLASSQLAARAYSHLGPRRMAVGGVCGVIAVWSVIGLTVGLDTNIWLIRVLIFCSGFAIPWCSIAAQTSSFATISSADTGRAAALFQTQGQVAAGIGVALLVTVVSSSRGAGAALVPAFHHAFFTAAALMALAGLIALTIRDSDAASTIVRRRERIGASPDPAAADPG
jgi:MFS family permease